MLAFHTYQNYLGPKIRGQEIAKYLNALYSHKYSKTRERGDTNIHIKPKSLDDIPDGDWVDICDGEYVPELLKSRPNIKAIALTQYSQEELSKILPNKIVWISQAHLNWDNEKRDRTEVTTCGYIGGPTQRARDIYKNIGDKLKKIGFDFITCFDFITRQDAIDFYKKIDILVIADPKDNHFYKSPAKMINAASFGVPSIAVPLNGYKEWEGNYVQAGDIVEEAQKLKNNYQYWSDKVLKASEPYHISHIAKKYEELNDLY